MATARRAFLGAERAANAAAPAMSAGQLTLWGAAKYRTGRVLWLLEEMSMPYTHKPVDIRAGTEAEVSEVAALNSRAKIPVLEDGALVLAESAAILSYLADTYGDGGSDTETAAAGAGAGAAAGGGSVFIPPPRTPERAVHDMWLFYRAFMTEAVCATYLTG